MHSDTLYLRLPAMDLHGTAPDAGYAWQLLAADGSLRQAGQGQWQDLVELLAPNLPAADATAAADDGPAVVLVLAAEDVLLTEAAVPARQRSKALRALPFVVEDQLAGELEQQHLVPGPFQPGAPVPVAVVARQVLDTWLERVRTLGLEPRAAVPDVLLLPVTGDAVAVAVEGDRCLVRSGPCTGLVVPTPLAAELVPTALAGRSGVALHAWELASNQVAAGDGAVVLSGLVTALATDGLEPVAGAGEAAEAAPVALLDLALADGHPEALALNLLVDSYTPRQARRQAGAPGWRSVAALAAALLVVVLAGDVARALWFDQAAGEANSAAEAAYRAAVPGTGPVTNLRGRLRVLGQGGGADGPGALALLGVLAAEVPAGRGYAVRSLSWNGNRAELAVELAAPGFAELDQVRDALAGRGLSVQISSAEQVDEGVQARLRLAGPGAQA